VPARSDRPAGPPFSSQRRLYPDLPAPVVGPAGDDAERLDLMPNDVAQELAAALRNERITIADPSRPESAMLTIRRTLNVMNTLGRWAPTYGDRNFKTYNPCQIHPEHLERLGIAADSIVELTSAHGRIRAIVEADPSVRPGTVTMSHCWENLPGLDEDPSVFVSNPGRLLSLTDGAERINAMPQMTAIPVIIAPVVAEPSVAPAPQCQASVTAGGSTAVLGRAGVDPPQNT
jgi:Molydopterin dinucleotide binding domain